MPNEPRQRGGDPDYPESTKRSDNDYKHPGAVFQNPRCGSGIEQASIALTSDFYARNEAPVLTDPRLLEVKQRIEQILAEHAGLEQGRPRTASSFEGLGNIQGVGIGCAGIGDTAIARPGQEILTIFLGKEASVEELKSLLIASAGIRMAVLEELPIKILVTGHIESHASTLESRQRYPADPLRLRPAAGGLSASVQDNDAGAGTLGCLAYGRTPPRDTRVLVLSNNHVFGNSNGGQTNDCILQPGTSDAGDCPRDQIATLERFIIIYFGGERENYVDCATGWCWPDRVRSELFYMSATGPAFFRISNTPIWPAPCNMAVGKSGKTTGMTLGYVNCNYVSLKASYPGNRVAIFKNQIGIEGNSTAFSEPGDSGSIVWEWNSPNRPVGLLFSGGTGELGRRITFANPMQYVLDALDIRLYT